jgi:hypothetical protein
VVAVEVSLGAVVVSLLDEGTELLALAPDGFYVALDLVLLCGEPLLELLFRALAIAEPS